MARRDRAGSMAAAVVLTLALVLLGLGGRALFRSLDASPDGRAPRERLSMLKAALGSDPPPPPGAELIVRHEFAGDNSSDGPSISWEYNFSGPATDFVEHYRLVLGQRGWSEEPPGNMPGQLTNFAQVVDGRRLTIALFSPVGGRGFVVDAFGSIG